MTEIKLVKTLQPLIMGEGIMFYAYSYSTSTITKQEALSQMTWVQHNNLFWVTSVGMCKQVLFIWRLSKSTGGMRRSSSDRSFDNSVVYIKDLP